jgi:hypothetical protein
MLWIARVLAATMLVFGTMGAVAALNLGDSPKGNLPVNWPAFNTSLVMALVGIIALFFIEPRIRRKN